MYCVPVNTCVSSVIPCFRCSLQISVLFVFMRVDISLFNSGMLGSYGVFLLVKFLCAIVLRMAGGRSLSVLRILPTGMCFFPAW